MAREIPGGLSINHGLIKGLRCHGYDVKHVQTGTDALTATTQERPALVPLDLGLPDMDGLQVLESLRRHAADVPVIVLTARAGDRARGLDLRADEFLTKPAPFTELLSPSRLSRPGVMRLSAHVDDVADAGRGEAGDLVRPFYVDYLRRHGVTAP